MSKDTIKRGRLPIISSLVVAIAVAGMIGLGWWQLDRRAEKQALLVRYGANLSLPATAFPSDPGDARYLFRTVSAYCLEVVGWRTIGGRMPGGGPGWRHIASCRRGAEGPGFTADVGVSPDPNFRPRWTGGPVRGTATWSPDATSAIGRWFGHGAIPVLMIVATNPASGLASSPRPDPRNVPNNHLAYAVQWFAFAAIAAIIYLIALRWRGVAPLRPPR